MRQQFKLPDSEGLWLLTVTVLVCLATAAFASGQHGSVLSAELVSSGISVRAQVKPFTPTVVLPGEIISTRTSDVVTHYRYWTAIRWLAPEGSAVSEGQVAAVVINDDIEYRVLQKRHLVMSGQARERTRCERSQLTQIERSHSVRMAERNLRSAELRLRELERGRESEEVRLAEIAVEKARLELGATGKAVERLHALAERAEVPKEHSQELEYERRVAEAHLKMAEADLRAVMCGPSELERLAARFQVALTRAKLAATKRAEAVAGEQQEAELAQERQKVNRVEVQHARWLDMRENLKRRAPMSGLALWPPIYLGGKSRPGLDNLWTAPIVTIIDPTAVAFLARATEEQVGRLAVGQAAQVKLRAFAGTVISGKIAAISLTSQDLSLKYRFGESEQRKETGVRVYDVMIKLDAEGRTDLFQGMTGRATITVGEPLEQVVIPRACVSRSSGKYSALVWRDGDWQARELVVASEDDRYVAVASGLSPGEKVAILAERPGLWEE